MNFERPDGERREEHFGRLGIQRLLTSLSFPLSPVPRRYRRRLPPKTYPACARVFFGAGIQKPV